MALSPEEEKSLLDQLSAHDIQESLAPKSLPSDEKQKLLWQLQKSDMSKMDQAALSGLNPQSAKDIPGELKNIGRGGLAGVLKLGQGIGELQAKGLRKLGVPIPSLQQSNLSDVNTGINKLYSPQVAQSPEGKIAFIAGQTAPFIGMPLGEGGMLAQVGKNAVASEALSPVFNPDQSVAQSYEQAVPSSIGAAGLTALLHTPSAVGNLLKMGGKATPEEFEANVQAAGNMPVSIGKLSNAPTVNKFESNVLSNLPFSGMSQKNMQVGQQLDQKVGNVLKELNVLPENKPKYKLTGDPDNPMEYVPQDTQIQKISDNIADNFEKNDVLKTKLYNERDKIVKKNNVKTSADTLNQEAQDILDKVYKEQQDKGFSRVSNDTIRELEAAVKSKEIPFENINFEKNAYNDKAEQARISGNRYERAIYKRLAGALNKDVKNTLSLPENKELADAQARADQHFKEKIAPILENPALRKHAERSANRDRVIADFVQTGAYEQPDKIKALFHNLSPEYKKQFSNEFLTSGLKELDGTQAVKSDSVLGIYSKLGDESKKIMFSPNQVQKLDRALKTRKTMGLDINQMINPKTGYAHAPLLVGGSAVAAAVGLGHTLSSALGLPPSIAYPLAVASVGGAGNLATRYLTGPASRNVYRTGLKLSKKGPIKPPVPPALLTNAFYQALNGGQQ
jgi:hypothetical protein